MPLELKQALTKLSRTPKAKLYFAFCEKDTSGKPFVIAHTKPIQEDVLEEFDEIPPAARAKLSKGTMKLADKKLVLMPRGGKSISGSTLESKVMIAVQNAKAKGLVEDVSVADQADDNEYDEKPRPATKPHEGTKHADPIDRK